MSQPDDEFAQALLGAAEGTGGGVGGERDVKVRRHHSSRVHQHNIELQQLPSTTADVFEREDVQVAATEPKPPTRLQQACAAIFYSAASLTVMFVNKV